MIKMRWSGINNRDHNSKDQFGKLIPFSPFFVLMFIHLDCFAPPPFTRPLRGNWSNQMFLTHTTYFLYENQPECPHFE